MKTYQNKSPKMKSANVYCNLCPNGRSNWSRRPDIVCVNKTENTYLIKDVAIDRDQTVDINEREKIEKYQNLKS